MTSALTVTVALPSLKRRPARIAPTVPDVAPSADSAPSDVAEPGSETGAPVGDVWRPSRLARMLALSYVIDDLVDGRAVRSFAEVARRLGVTRARVCQLAKLRWLPVEEQEAILMGEAVRASERRMRPCN